METKKELYLSEIESKLSHIGALVADITGYIRNAEQELKQLQEEVEEYYVELDKQDLKP